MENPELPSNEDEVTQLRANSAQVERAITDAQNLVNYTANAGIEVDKDILTTLIIAKNIWDKGEWTPEFEVRFWEAFRQMKPKIAPATVASVRAISLDPKKPGAFRAFFQEQYGRSAARRATNRYTLWTLFVLFIVLFFQIYWVIGNSLSIRLTELLNSEIELTDAINQAKLEYAGLEVRFKLTEDEGREGEADVSYEFYNSADWERETLAIITARQRAEDLLESLRSQLERNYAILDDWSRGWKWILVDEGDIPENEEIKKQYDSINGQIVEATRLINDQDIQQEIKEREDNLVKLKEELVTLDIQLASLVTQQAETLEAQVMEETPGETISEPLLVNPVLDETVKQREIIYATITEEEKWLGQPRLVEIVKDERQATLDQMNVESAALARQLKQEATKEEARRVRLTTDFALIVLQSYLLPVLYGLLGASVYVLRSMTREISKVEFSGESHSSYLLRLALGTLAGLIIGWFVFLLPGQSILGSISPLALAFLVGYNIEPVFALMDGLVEKIFTGVIKMKMTRRALKRLLKRVNQTQRRTRMNLIPQQRCNRLALCQNLIQTDHFGPPACPIG